METKLIVEEREFRPEPGTLVVFRPIIRLTPYTVIPLDDSNCIVKSGRKGTIIERHEYTTEVQFDGRDVTDLVTTDFLTTPILTPVGVILKNIIERRRKH